MAAFVQSLDAAQALKAAEDHWAAGEQPQAFADLAEALDALINDYLRDKRTWRGSLFDATKYLEQGFSRRGYMREASADAVAYHQAIEASLGELSDSVMLVGLGIDLGQYVRFNALTPNLSYIQGSGKRRYGIPNYWSRTNEDFAFCRDFVIATSLLLDERDYDFEPDEARISAGDGTQHVFVEPSAIAPDDRDTGG